MTCVRDKFKRAGDDVRAIAVDLAQLFLSRDVEGLGGDGTNPMNVTDSTVRSSEVCVGSSAEGEAKPPEDVLDKATVGVVLVRLNEVADEPWLQLLSSLLKDGEDLTVVGFG